MKKNEFVKKVTEYVRSIENAHGEQVFEVTLKETDAYLAAIKAAIIDELHDGGEVTWPGLAKFSVGDQAARTARNPRTGEVVNVPAKKKVKVKALGDLKSSVQ